MSRARRKTTAPEAAPSPAARIDLDARKERVLHTRVPESLDRHLKHRASNLGLSVSMVVRNVLLNTFGLVEDIVTDGTNLALTIAGADSDATGTRLRQRPSRAGAAQYAESAEIIGWQEAILNLNGVCERCNALLAKGSRAAIGVREGPGPCSLLCKRCLTELEAADTPKTRNRKRR